jgi:hypothetical protein
MTILLVHVVFAAASIGAGLLAMRASKFSSKHTRIGELYHWLMLITCVSALALSYSRGRASIFTYLTPPSYALALLGYLMAKYRPSRWLAWHIAGQSSSFIALMTGVLFQLVPRFWHSDASVLGFSPVFWVTLLTPFVVGTFFIVRTEKKWKQVSVRPVHASTLHSGAKAS